MVPGPPDLLAASIRLASAEAELVREWNGATLLCDRLRPAALTYDLILLDCSPSLGLLTINALAAANHVLYRRAYELTFLIHGWSQSERMRSGSATSRFQAMQQASTMAR